MHEISDVDRVTLSSYAVSFIYSTSKKYEGKPFHMASGFVFASEDASDFRVIVTVKHFVESLVQRNKQGTVTSLSVVHRSLSSESHNIEVDIPLSKIDELFSLAKGDTDLSVCKITKDIGKSFEENRIPSIRYGLHFGEQDDSQVLGLLIGYSSHETTTVLKSRIHTIENNEQYTHDVIGIGKMCNRIIPIKAVLQESLKLHFKLCRNNLPTLTGMSGSPIVVADPANPTSFKFAGQQIAEFVRNGSIEYVVATPAHQVAKAIASCLLPSGSDESTSKTEV
ncbi:hypothetical protein [Rhodopirellula bahusiensis]|uniref:Serine protease n=1 Tax=Rhodopirellula bahusiensis TaxID=2014065 RepID=A0A2G1W6Z4_9BACT|nr:hypothetical protein [Rhodopirellula bahusiensis]PHQ34813.1 hypothetical protein CEE69_13145 [Rhodopirellula bahusiensis]